MSTTVSAYLVTRADGTSFDLPLRIQSTLVAGDEVVPPDGDTIVDGNGDVIGTIAPRLAVWQDVEPNAIKSFATWWVPRLRGAFGALGFKMMRVEFSWPDDGGIEGDPAHPHGPYGTQWVIRRADVIEELSLADVEALAAA